MRPATIASVVILSLSTAAIGQVATASVEQKIPSDNGTAPGGTIADGNIAASADDVEASPGAPSTALVDSTDGTSAGPPR